MSEPRRPRHHRPVLPGAGRFEALPGEVDPAARTEAADRCATLLVRGAHNTADEDVIGRVVHLAETEGLDTLADLWSGSPADSLAGSLWRLYLLRAWVHADPVAAAREFDAGRAHTPVHEGGAGGVDPPTPEEGRRPPGPGPRGGGRGGFPRRPPRRCAGSPTGCCAGWCAATSRTRCSERVRSPGWWRRAARRSARAMR